MNKPMTPAEVAKALAAAVEHRPPVSAVMVGVAAFVAAYIYKNYPEPLRKNMIVTHANVVYDMVARVESQEVADAAETLQEPEEGTDAFGKKWVQ